MPSCTHTGSEWCLWQWFRWARWTGFRCVVPETATNVAVDVREGATIVFSATRGSVPAGSAA